MKKLEHMYEVIYTVAARRRWCMSIFHLDLVRKKYWSILDIFYNESIKIQQIYVLEFSNYQNVYSAVGTLRHTKVTINTSQNKQFSATGKY